ncbi:MAG: murein biosynthesis integral membrane protein MurJ [Acidimicrobiia bacterium]
MSDAAALPSVETPAGGASLLRSSGIVALGTALSRSTGFVRLAATAYAIGFGALNDTYTLANTTPNIVYELLLGGVLSATLVPVFVSHAEDGDDEGTSAVISVATAALIAVTVIGVLAAPLLVRVYTVTAESGVAEEQREVATNFLRLFMPQMVFYGLTAMGTALLNARRSFALPAFAPALNNLVVTAVLVSLPHVAGQAPTLNDIRDDRGLLLLLGLGTTAGVALMTVALLPAVKRSGFRFRPNFDIRNPAVREVGRMSGWTLGYVLTNQVALLVVYLLANRQVGGVSTYTAAYVFFLLPHALIAVSIMTTFVPELASAARADDRATYRERFSSGIRLMALVILPAATGYVVLARPIVRALLQRGALETASANLAADNLAMFALGLLGFSIYLFTLRGFYALRDTRTPFLLGLAQNGMNIAFAFALEPAIGVPGLALAYGLAYTVAAVLAVWALRRRMGSLDSGRVLRSLARIALASLAMAAAVAATIQIVPDVDLVQTVAGIAVGAVVYLGAVLALRVDEVATVRSRFFGR